MLFSISREVSTLVDVELTFDLWEATEAAITSEWAVRACKKDSPERLPSAGDGIPRVACKIARSPGGAEGKWARAVLMVIFSARKMESDSLSADILGDLLADDNDASLMPQWLG
jgi:hypothetical protein